MTTNRQFTLARRPSGMVGADDFAFGEAAIPEPAEGEFLVRSRYVSLDPAMRGWMNDVRSYLPPVALGDVMRAQAAGEVVASRHPSFAPGDKVVGLFGVQDYAVSDGTDVRRASTDTTPLTAHLSALGMTGMTAYFGLLDICRPVTGETVVVSGAAGAVGGLDGQIARIKGCRAVGIAGGAEKCGYVTEELGFDACIDYKNDDVRCALKEHCPGGVDVYFDNVGGPVLDLVLARLRRGGRVALSGAISSYNADGPVNQVRMAPLYDVASALPYPDFHAPKFKMAMKLGGTYQAGRVGTKQWRTVAKQLSLKEDDVLGRIEQLAAELPTSMAAAAEHRSVRD